MRVAVPKAVLIPLLVVVGMVLGAVLLSGFVAWRMFRAAE